MVDEDARVVQILNKSFGRGRNPSVQLLGGRIESFDRPTSTLIMSYSAEERLNNGNGQVMGGFLAAIMDVTVAQAIVVQSRLKQTVSTLEQKVSLLAPVRLPHVDKSNVEGRLRCQATAVKRGKTIAFYEVSLFDATGKLVARATQTALVLDIVRRQPKATRHRPKL
mmetsp:Transcript_14581/g.37506  ORF Transcript_14581/g.37506 Transcript_14581/m.37506 type:complete len:167 (+) Transcript_14581:226-726(+)